MGAGVRLFAYWKSGAGPSSLAYCPPRGSYKATTGTKLLAAAPR